MRQSNHFPALSLHPKQENDVDLSRLAIDFCLSSNLIGMTLIGFNEYVIGWQKRCNVTSNLIFLGLKFFKFQILERCTDFQWTVFQMEHYLVDLNSAANLSPLSPNQFAQRATSKREHRFAVQWLNGERKACRFTGAGAVLLESWQVRLGRYRGGQLPKRQSGVRPKSSRNIKSQLVAANSSAEPFWGDFQPLSCFKRLQIWHQLYPYYLRLSASDLS